MWYFTGTEGYTKDPVKAAEWMRKSADQGDPDGRKLHGTILRQRQRRGEEPRDAPIQWLQKAAGQGEPHACFSLGTASEKGLGGLEPNTAKAIEWYRKAGNLPKAKEALARLHAGG